MIHGKLSHALCYCVWALVLSPHNLWGEVSGRRGDSQFYTSADRTRSPAEDDPVITAQMDKVAFRLNTWSGKWRVVRFRIVNRRDSTLSMSSAKDLVHAFAQGKQVAATLIPSRVAPELWDALDAGTRADLAYPLSIGPRDELGVYLFFPAEALRAVPDKFTWRIDSIDKTYVVQPPPQTAD